MVRITRRDFLLGTGSTFALAMAGVSCAPGAAAPLVVQGLVDLAIAIGASALYDHIDEFFSENRNGDADALQAAIDQLAQQGYPNATSELFGCDESALFFAATRDNGRGGAAAVVRPAQMSVITTPGPVVVALGRYARWLRRNHDIDADQIRQGTLPAGHVSGDLLGFEAVGAATFPTELGMATVRYWPPGVHGQNAQVRVRADGFLGGPISHEFVIRGVRGII